ncbi:unnamed protein product [Medioppia subpectinata]|uniref:SprT-like domain-containing protein n=1 Tax=Medioppia subpectinata TaxID=1979941 RepID=A0A7R9PZE5_9ACAR|nr:unnamed protein product [Medioppia subpectinata]CAG2106894.1 unnamed protein product [Medioppia subpectinata]
MPAMAAEGWDPFADNTAIQDMNDDYLMALSLQAIEDEFNSHSQSSAVVGHESDHRLATDYELAIELSRELAKDEADNGPMDPTDIVSPRLELSDPSPNIWELMKIFDRMFFAGVLAKHCIELSWSSRMTSTAGLCGWDPHTNFCFIRLSLPLLQLRSRKDLVETLIHEMIHALLFVTKQDDNHESHGQKFHEHMYRINRMSGTDITVYHSFHDEVRSYQQHVWRCDGPCRTRAPYFGYVRRAMNRKPGPSDYWYKFHEKSCGGMFTKESEPPPKTTHTNASQSITLTPEKLNNKDIRDYLTPNVWTSATVSTTDANESEKPKVELFAGKGHRLGNIKTENNPKSVINCDNFNQTSGSSLLSIDGKPIVPFTGRGHVLGSRQTVGQLGSTSAATSSAPKPKSLPKHVPQKKTTNKTQNIEVIQID